MMLERLRWFLGRRTHEAGMDREFQSHLETEIEERIDRGMRPEDARRTALRDFGNVMLTKENARLAWFPRWLDRSRQDLGYAFRALRRNPGLVAVTVFSLALGIGVNTVVFSIVESVLLRPFPYRDPDQLVFMWGGPDGASQESHLPGTDLLAWRDQSTLLDGIAPYSGPATESGSGGPIRLSRVGREIFDVLGVRPLLGPGFPIDRPMTVVLSYGLWQSQFGGDADVVGKTLDLNNGPREIAGVMPRGFFFPEPGVDVWWNIAMMDLEAPSPLAQFMPDYNGQSMSNAEVGSYLGVARLRPEADAQRAQAELDVIFAGSENKSTLFPIRETVVGSYRLVLWMLLGAVGLLLLLASSNVANLLLARGIARQKELAVRCTLGAGRGRLVGQLMTESLMLAVIAGAAALAVAWWGIDLVLGQDLVDVPRIDSTSMNWPVVLFAGSASLAAGLASGLLPAWRTSRVELNESLKVGRAQTVSQAGSSRLRDLIVVAQVAMALVLLVGTGLLVHSAVALARIEWGFEAENAAVMTVDSMTFNLGVNPPRMLELAEAAVEGLRAIPGVESASVGVSAPLVEGNVFRSERVVAGDAAVSSAVPATSYIVGSAYFRTLGVPVRGQSFEDAGPGSGVEGVILSESLAARLFPDVDPIGRTLHLAQATERPEMVFGPEWDAEAILVQGSADPAAYSTSEATRRIVIGVAGDFRMRGNLSAGRPEPAVFIDYRQAFTSGNPAALNVMRPNKFLIRSDQPFEPLIETARARLLEVDSGFQFRATARMEDLVARALGGTGSNKLMLSLSLVFGALSLLLAALGIYGAMSHAVSRRTSEFGIRMALGARRGDVLRIVLKQSLSLTLPGLLLGLAGAWAATRILTTLLFGITPTDLPTFLGVTLFLLIVAVAASLVPAIRASSVDPLAATRAE